MTEKLKLSTTEFFLRYQSIVLQSSGEKIDDQQEDTVRMQQQILRTDIKENV